MNAIEKKVTHNEVLKALVPTLAGRIAATLNDPSVDHFAEDDEQFLKFHGIYQHDDRDKRKTGKQYLFMVRGRIPGGGVSPAQYLVFDDLATRYGNNTLRITSRQSFQFHGVVKSGLGPLMKAINDALLTTLAACGDVNRNVMAPPTPAQNAIAELVREDARKVSEALLPCTKAYHAIWVEGVQLDLAAKENREFVDPLYGRTYLPRKFKIAFAIPPLNDVDVLANCLGFIAIVEHGQLTGYNLTAGGGMGMSHNNAETYPRLADVIGFLPRAQVIEVAKTVLTIHRDFGDRTNRKHARLKYVLAEKGVAWFRAELEQRLGGKLAAPRRHQFTRQGDTFGWHRQFDGREFLGLYVETGRIKDAGGYRLKTALREIVSRFQVEVRLTPSQNLLLVNVNPADRPAITEFLGRHGVPADNQARAIRLSSMACPALPTCGLALAESERFAPELLTRLEHLLAEHGLENEAIVIRMTGCPNGCARPYTAEIGFVGKAPGKYHIYLGGNAQSTRMNRLFKESVKDAELVNELRPVLARFAREREAGERFGDWAARILWADKV
jgi:sulfite reductase (NADPH) hemoprotein beta-component